MEGKYKIAGTPALVDNFGRGHDYLRLSLTDRCNLRCTYCMPKNPLFLPYKKLLSAEEIDRLVSAFVKLGITKIRLTGGEPLIRKDFPEIARNIARNGMPLHLTTNATRLHEHYDLISELFSSINISLDTLRPERFKQIAQSNEFEKTLQNLDLALESSIPTKINMVVVRDVNHDEITDFIKLTLKHPIEIRFIEFMPFKGNQWKLNKSVSHNEILKLISKDYNIENLGRRSGETAEKFRIKNAPGKFGIISTVSHPFCTDCNRIRVTAEGKLKNCLFSRNEINLKDLINNEEQLIAAISGAIKGKRKSFGGNVPMINSPETKAYNLNRSMTSIGG